MSGRSAALILSAALSLAASACAPAEQGVSQGLAGDPAITMSEGPCPHNTCPVYDMTLRPGGAYILNGVKYVKTVGVAEGDLGPDAFAAAEKALTDAAFWTLKPVQTPATLDTCHPDGPDVHITWRTAEGKEKTLTYNAACDVEKLNLLVADLRAALHFEQLVWTSERFQFDPEHPA